MGPGYPADRFLSPVHVTEGGGSAAVTRSRAEAAGAACPWGVAGLEARSHGEG